MLTKITNSLAVVNSALLLPLLVVLVVEYCTDTGEQYAELNYLMCGTFGAEWAFGLVLAEDRKAYLRSPEKIADAVSSIPFSLLFSGVRVLRLARVLRFARVVMRMRGATETLRSLARAGCLVISIVLSSAIAIQAVEPGYMTFEQAVWWVIVTMSTVGYGDLAPGTPAGHAVATCVILTGVGVFGYLAGLSATLLGANQGCPGGALGEHHDDPEHQGRAREVQAVAKMGADSSV